MILFIQTAFLGDLLLSIPTLKRLRQIYPNTPIHLLCRKGLGEFFVAQKLADRVYDDFRGVKPSLGEIRKTFGGTKYDLLICPHQSFRSSCASLLIPARLKIGYKSALNALIFHRTVKRPMSLPEVLRQMALLQSLDGETAELLTSVGAQQAPFKNIPSGTAMNVELGESRSALKEKLVRDLNLETGRKIVMLAPGSVWPTKRWREEHFVELAQALIRQNHQVVLIGSPAEKDISDRIQSQVPQARNITGKTTIPAMIERIGGADVLVSNDSGAMHMASVANTACVALFGPTVQEFGYQPWSAKSRVYERLGLACRPCSSHGGAVCPIGTHECMTTLLPRDVLSGIDYFLA